MSRLLPVFFLLQLLAVVSTGQAQSDSFSTFVGQIPSNHTELFAINGTADRVEGILSNDAVRRVFDSEAMLGLGGGTTMLDDGLDWLDDNRKWFPTTVVVAGEPKMYQSATNLVRILIDGFLYEQGTVENPDEFRKELNQLAAELVETADQLRIPELTIYADWADTETAEVLFQGLAQNVRPVGMFTELNVDVEDSSLTIHGQVQDALPEVQIDQILQGLMTEEVSGLVEKLAAIPVHLHIARVENGIRISLGSERNESRPMTLKSLPNFEDAANVIAYANWNTREFKQSAAKLTDDLDRWKKTALGKIATENDQEDFMGSLSRSFGSLKSFSDRGQLIVKSAPGKIPWRARVFRSP